MMQEIKEVKAFLFAKKESLTKQVLRNSLYSFGTNLIAKVGGLIFTILIARIFLPELFGLYSLVLSIILTIATFTDLGINTTLSRYLSESLAKKEKEPEARSRFRFLLRLKVILSFIISAILFLFSSFISNFIFHKPELTAPLQIGALYLFAISIQGFFGTIFYPLRKLEHNFISEALFQISRASLFLVFILFYKSSVYKDVKIVFLILTIATLISSLYYLLVLSLKYKKIFIGKIIPIEKIRIFSFLGWTIILSTSVVIFGHIDIIMLGIFAPNEFVGYYAILLSFMGAVAGLVSFGGVLLPVFTEINRERLERGFKKIIKYLAILAIPSAIGLAFVIIPIIKVIYGPEYVPEAFYIPIMITSVILSLLVIECIFSGIYNSLFMAKEKVKIPAKVMMLAILSNIILNYAFIKIALLYHQAFAIFAVALATFITRYGNLITLTNLAKKKLNVKIEEGSLSKPLIASLVMLVFLFVFDYFVTMSIFTGILMIILAILVYFVSLSTLNKI